MTSRTSWHSDHPPACTCVACTDFKRAKNQIKGKIGRNQKCPCGSGVKYKKCHGN